MTVRKGALTTYYPEETRSDYATNNRGKHVLTQRPDGRPQCIACNMCATVCPAKVIEIEAAFDPDDPAHPKYPARFEIDYSRCIFCGLCVEACPEDAIRMVKEVPNLPPRDRDHMWLVDGRAPHLEPAERRRQALSGRRAAARTSEARHDRDAARQPRHAAALLFAATALAGAALMLVLRHPMQVALALISTMVFLGGRLRRCSACTSSRCSRC